MRGEAVRDVLAGEADDAEGRRSLLFERRSLALNRASLDSSGAFVQGRESLEREGLVQGRDGGR